MWILNLVVNHSKVHLFRALFIDAAEAVASAESFVGLYASDCRLDNVAHWCFPNESYSAAQRLLTSIAINERQ